MLVITTGHTSLKEQDLVLKIIKLNHIYLDILI